ncbi:formyltetrahydrofolate deformylase [filamentous cyanobacterium LEGE 11480]|uniref:Formyltetrahydrofolate deformylase n=1 Tax=Romeriopsis navalis LEGE 11480 TaxID=2777977 RepID=A0A928Z4V7_9CYAN|nr:formyltetrahydrofolate deformylase [Romeriopsis navalis]MBE9030798.1 formyltetrahydrofolate deformylase [Romeriopsis navalis LEGE 11480]
MTASQKYILTLSCPDRVGVVAAVSGFIAQHQGWIIEAQHHSDELDQRFFMREEILAASLAISLEQFREAFQSIATEFQMDWEITDSAQKKRVVILVSKSEHCIYDLLSRWQSGELDIDIPCVISNHERFRKLVEWHDIPFHYIPVTRETKEAAYEKVMQTYDAAQGNTMVLARYMQVLSPQMCDRYRGQIINIHHSFLPSFVGAKPYHQAYARGVKLIGATCHYVTEELDAGPIIEQDVIRIDHSDTTADLIRYGKDIEKTVLARGLRYHVEDRVLRHGNKTVVFR